MKRCDFKGMLPFAALAALSGCATEPAPVVAPPPVVVIPPQPRPPVGAPLNLAVPPADAFGVRHTINTGISPVQTVWNLRSAYNVAALNCVKPQHAAILEGYRQFLKTHAVRLRAVTREMDKEFKEKAGAGYVRVREAYMTQVYNYYALPPTLPAFCDAALAMSIEGASVPAKDLDSFAANSLPTLDAIFLRFYDSYEQYRADLAAWRQRYAPQTPVLTIPPVGPGRAPLATPPAPAAIPAPTLRIP
ncbi:MAG: hypothetical protein ABIT04_04455 [Novosphingobium sp.]